MKYIKYIHDYIELLYAKGVSIYFSPDQIDLAVYRASFDKFNDTYKPAGSIQRISDSLKPFISDPTSVAIGDSGNGTYPTGYIHPASLRTGTKPIEIVEEQFLPDKLDSALCGPDSNYPIAVFYKTYIQFYPITVSNVTLVFYKEPIQPIYAYTEVNGRAVYDDDNSVDIEWGPQDHNDITIRAFGILGINMRESDIINISSAIEQKNGNNNA